MPEAGPLPGRFVRYRLRTTDPAAALAFYRRILGAAVEHPCIEIGTLPQRARARGAPAHWLGHVAVADVGAAVDAFLSEGAARLGPPAPGRSEGAPVVLRDPFGAVLALDVARPDPGATEPPPVVWHALAVNDAGRAFGLYTRTLGWKAGAVFDPGGGGGLQRGFTWHRSGRGAGSVSDDAARPGIHPHWLYLFGVSDLEGSAAAVRALGGTALPPTRAPGGRLAVMCEDPQGAVFGLLDHATDTS